MFDLMRWPVADDLAASDVPAGIVYAMRHEVTNAGLVTQAMCQALMKQALIMLLRRHWQQLAAQIA